MLDDTPEKRISFRSDIISAAECSHSYLLVVQRYKGSTIQTTKPISCWPFDPVAPTVDFLTDVTTSLGRDLSRAVRLVRKQLGSMKHLLALLPTFL